MKDNKKVSNSRLGSIWLTVFLLCILILASMALLGSFIKRYAGQEKNVIAVMADSNALKQEYDDTNLPMGATPDLVPSWETETSVDLFQTFYTDAEGNVTVESSNGDKVIAPGTANDYEFTLKNTGNISLDYTLKLDGIFEISDHHLPFYVRLSEGDRWLVGGENEWVLAEQMKTLLEQRTLPSGDTTTYVFEWQWPYETDDESQKLINDLNDTLMSTDITDTNIGSIATNVNTDFRLNIVTTSVVTPGAVPVYQDGVGVMTEFLFVTVMTGLILFSGIWLILIFFRRKIYLTGIVTGGNDGEAKLGNARSTIAGGRFVFPKARFGKRTLKAGYAKSDIRFRSRKYDNGIYFEEKDGTLVVTVGRTIRIVELYVAADGQTLSVSTAQWAAIDKKHNVYTQAGVTAPQDGSNTTPSGFSIDKHNRIEF